MPAKPTRRSRTARPTPAARLSVERLDARVVPAIVNPAAIALSAVTVGTPISPDQSLATFDSPSAAAGLTATVSVNGGAELAGVVVATGPGSDGVPEYAVRLPGGAFTPTVAGTGALDFVVTVADAADGTSAQVSGTADVGANPPAAEPAVVVTVPPLVTSAGVAMTDVRVATFIAADPQATAADYTATVNWGNGTTTAATVLATGSDGAGAGFAVFADYTYPAPLPAGSTISVTVRNTDTDTPYTGSGAVAVSATNLQPVLSEPQQFVRGLYLRELNRPGTTVELDGWVSVMGGANGRTNVANAISRSAEARTRQVSGWYQTYLGRTAQGGEASGWVQLLQQGATEEQVQGGILGSQEFANRAQTLISSGTPAERQVQVMYSSLLGRYANSVETGDWVTVLSQRGSAAVAGGLLNGIEYRTRVVENYYLTILGRPADAAGLHGWVHSGLETVTVRAAISAVSTGPIYYPMPV